MATVINTTNSVTIGSFDGVPFYFPATIEAYKASDGSLIVVHMKDQEKVYITISTNGGASWSSSYILSSSFSACTIIPVGDDFILLYMPESTGYWTSRYYTYDSGTHTFSAGTARSQATGFSGGVRPIMQAEFDSRYWAFPVRGGSSTMYAYFGTDPSVSWTGVYSSLSSSVRAVSAVAMSDRLKMFAVSAGALYSAEITGSGGSYSYGAYSQIVASVNDNGKSLDTYYVSDTEIYVSFATSAGLYIMQYNGTGYETPVQITDQTGSHGCFCTVQGVPVFFYVTNDGAGNYGISYKVYGGANTWGSAVEVIAPQSGYTIYHLKTQESEDTTDVSLYYVVSTGSYNMMFESVEVALGKSIAVDEGIKVSESFVMEPHYPWWDDRGQTINPACCYCMEATTNVAGLDHLEGQVVAILANGEVLDEQIVVNGQISLEEYYSKIAAGLPYEADLETLKINVALKNGGTVQGLRMKVNNVTFHLRDTKGGQIGPDEDNLYDAFTVDNINQYSGQNLDEFDLYTGKLRMPLGGQYDYGGHILIRQRDPLPLTVGSVIPEVDIGGLSR